MTDLERLSALVAALRASGVSHYDGPLPDAEHMPGSVKLIVQPLEAAPAPAQERPAPRKAGPMSLDELEAKVRGHVRLHGGGG